MKHALRQKGFITVVIALSLIMSCNQTPKEKEQMRQQHSISAKEILGNPNYQAISYGGYRKISRDSQPTIKELKEDMKLLAAMGIKVLRTYNVQLPHASNVCKAISELKEEESSFEMYVMLGAWIDCLNAWTDQPVNHNIESPDNEAEIERAVKLAKQYPEIIKVIAVGNEAMVKWATSYYVQPSVILKWVTHLQELKKSGELPKDLWITSSDDFASWGGGESSYHTKDLEQLIKAVDYISMHTYPYHNTHYNPQFWYVPANQTELSKKKQVDLAMKRAIDFARKQYDSVYNYMKSLGVSKPIHIGETGWSSVSNGYYSATGSRASDEYKQGLYYKLMREFTNTNKISCFYFEAFDEQWKDAANPLGSENHFGLFTLDGQAKYPIWHLVDQGVFEGLGRNGKPVTKTYDGDLELLMKDVLSPPSQLEVSVAE